MQHKDRLSDEERIARRKEVTRKYREANREKAREASRISQAKRRQDEAVREAEKAYKNKPEYIAKQREYRAANREVLNAKCLEWREANPERYAEYQKRYNEEHVADAAIRKKKWRTENEYHAREYGRKWRQENPELNALKTTRRRARKLEAGGELPKDIYKRLMKLQRCMCAVCRVDLKVSGRHLDHIMPLALGGTNNYDNVQLLCPTCNLTKSAKHPIDFMQSRGFLL